MHGAVTVLCGTRRWIAERRPDVMQASDRHVKNRTLKNIKGRGTSWQNPPNVSLSVCCVQPAVRRVAVWICMPVLRWFNSCYLRHPLRLVTLHHEFVLWLSAFLSSARHPCLNQAPLTLLVVR